MKALFQQRHYRAFAANHNGSVYQQAGCRLCLHRSVGSQLQHRGHSQGQVSRMYGANSQQKALRTSRTAVQSSAQAASVSSLDAIKAALFEALEGTERGIYGVPAEQRQAILDLIQQLEGHGSTDGITRDLQRVAGDWRLLFSTIAITGKRRTKLGLRNFISLGSFVQSIDVASCHASNRVDFNLSGLSFLSGFLQIDATYQVAGPSRVAIDFEKACLEPSQLQDLFEQNYDLLLSIFNPAGWLDITYLDDRLRVGRDDKSNVFLLERA